MHHSKIKVGNYVKVTGFIAPRRHDVDIIKVHTGSIGKVISGLIDGDYVILTVEFQDGTKVNIHPSELCLIEEPVKDAVKHLFVNKANGQWFYGTIIHTTEKNLSVDKCGLQNEEVLVCKDDYKIYLEVKL